MRAVPVTPRCRVKTPAYKGSKYLVNKPKASLNLEYQITTKNSINLSEDLTMLKVNGNYGILTYDFKDLYVNNPTK